MATRKSLRGRLAALCAAVALLLSACAKAPEQAATPSPAPQQTVNPALPEGMQALEQALLAGAQPALKLETAVLGENAAIDSVRIPSQILTQFLDALSGGTWQHGDEGYTYAATSGGDFTYDKPYSELIEGSATDVFTIEDDEGWVEEVVDNIRYDPFTWVMSGEGGGDFAYASAYRLADSGGEGRLETVSRLNGSISGWSYDLFRATDGQYRFLDLQLSPNEDGTIEAPYRWVLCVGWMDRDNAWIEEYELNTDTMDLPLGSLSLDQTRESLFMDASRGAKRLTQLKYEGGKLSYAEY